jgi:hypothetical protein
VGHIPAGHRVLRLALCVPIALAAIGCGYLSTTYVELGVLGYVGPWAAGAGAMLVAGRPGFLVQLATYVAYLLGLSLAVGVGEAYSILPALFAAMLFYTALAGHGGVAVMVAQRTVRLGRAAWRDPRALIGITVLLASAGVIGRVFLAPS